MSSDTRPPREFDDVDAVLLVASALSATGDSDATAVWLKRAVEIDPLNVHAWTELALLPGSQITPDQIAHVRSIDTQRELDDERRAVWALGLSRMYERVGDPDEAWEFVEQMNAALRCSRPYTREPDAVMLADIVDHLTPDHFERHRAADTGSQIPIFVFGLPRSGTTLVEQILSSHRDVRAGGEMGAMTDLAVHAYRAGPRTGSYVRALPVLPATTWDELRTQALDTYTSEAAGRRRVIDKMPGNYRHLGLMAVLFPRAKFVSVRRNPMDVCVSNYRLSYERHHSWANSCSSIAHTWADHRDVMRHWTSVCPVEIHELRYEDLVADQIGETRRLLEYCGLDWDDACLQFHEQRRHVATASRYQVRRPMYTSSVGAWRTYEPYVDDLRSALAAVGAPIR